MANKSISLKLIFILGLSILGTIGALGGVWLLSIYQDYREIEQRSIVANQIANGGFQLTTLTGEYLIYRGSRAKKQWRQRHLSMGKILDEAGVRGTSKDNFLQNLNHDFNRSLILFDRVVETSGASRDKKKIGPFTKFEKKRLASELLSATQSLASQASLTAKKARLEHKQATQRTAWMTGVFMASLTVVLLALWWVLASRVIQPIKNLRDDILAFGDDLNHQVGLERDDEIGNVAASFNKMSERLRETLVSKDKLTKEVRERQQTEEKLLESENSLREAQQIAHIGNWSLKVSTGELHWSDEIYRIFGYNPGEFEPSYERFFETVHPDDVAMVKASKEAAFSKGNHHSVDHRIVLPDGTIKWVHEAAVTRRGPDGKPVDLSGTIQDITERKQAEEKIAASLAEKEVLIREVNHRVKNNLQVISSMLSLQASGETDNRSLEALEDSQRRVRAMARIHEKLHQSDDLTSINAREYLSAVLEDTIESGENGAQKISSRLIVDDIIIDIDHAVACGQIISELVSNSLKHAFPNGQPGNIEVSLLQKDGRRVELSVADDGKGFPEGLDFKKSKTLGLRLIDALAMQLNGEVNIDGAGGARVQITFSEKRS